jgi:ADP-ribosyl-[dinitrogen reductase] hydrolase
MPVKWPIRWDLRTSETHPLQIDWITSNLFTGRIGITLCPGKYQPVSWSGGWNRNLEIDIDVIGDSGSTVVVSLVEDNEMRVLGVQGLGKAILAREMEWIHIPFEDTTAPDYKWMQDFDLVAPSILTSIKNGDSIVIHCKGGLSRAGTVVALLLCSMGMEVFSAIQLIRNVRSKNCINSIQQEFLISVTRHWMFKYKYEL